MRRNRFGRFIGRIQQDQGPLNNLLTNLVTLLNMLVVLISYSPLLLIFYVIFQMFDIKNVFQNIVEKYICRCNSKDYNGGKSI